MGKIIKSMNIFQVIAAFVFVVIFSATTYTIYTYVKLTQSWPLENFDGHVISPVDLATDTTLLAGGTFTRRVQCSMYDFNLQLRNPITKDIIILKPEHLATTPKSSMSPAKDIQIKFALFIPQNLYTGHWTPTFTGKYWCRYGIFTANKIQEVTVESFEVIDSSTTE